MRILVNVLISAIGIIIAAYILPGVHIDTFITALIVAIIFAFINTFFKPVIKILTLPINILTLGLFSLLVNGLLVLIVSALVPGFQVNGILWAIIFSILLSLITALMNMVI